MSKNQFRPLPSLEPISTLVKIVFVFDADIFSGDARVALTEDRDKDSNFDLIQATAKPAHHVMSTALALSMELLLLRRDSAIRTSIVVPCANRYRLRSVPLRKEFLWGYLCLRSVC